MSRHTPPAVPSGKNRAQLIEEVAALQQRVAQLESQLGADIAADTARSAQVSPSVEGLFAYFVDNVDAHVFIKDRAGRYLFINRKTETVFNISREALAQRVYTDVDFFDEATTQTLTRNDRQVMESGEAIEFEEILRLEGLANADRKAEVRHYMVLKFPLKDEAGNVIGLCGFSHDMTRVKDAEAALRASEERFRHLSEAAMEGIVFHDGGVVVSSNRTFARMFRYDPAVDLAGTSILDFVAPESRAVVRERVRGHSEAPYEIVGQRADGSRFPMEIIARETPYQGRTARVVVVRDISERKQADQQRLELEREKDRAIVLQYFISDASHDLRTPLTTIKTSLHLLSRLDDPDRRKRHLAILKTQTDHLERLLEQMLQMTRLDAVSTFQFGPVDLNYLVKLVFGQHEDKAARNGQTFDFVPGTGLPGVQGDTSHLNRALTILVENALNYTPGGGRIVIQTYRQDAQVVVKIEDTGIGIHAADMPHIFDRFFRGDRARNTEKGGVGLGLSIAKKIIEAHQGTIEAESAPGEGSTFWVRLPVT